MQAIRILSLGAIFLVSGDAPACDIGRSSPAPPTPTIKVLLVESFGTEILPDEFYVIQFTERLLIIQIDVKL